MQASKANEKHALGLSLLFCHPQFIRECLGSPSTCLLNQHRAPDHHLPFFLMSSFHEDDSFAVMTMITPSCTKAWDQLQHSRAQTAEMTVSFQNESHLQLQRLLSVYAVSFFWFLLLLLLQQQNRRLAHCMLMVNYALTIGILMVSATLMSMCSFALFALPFVIGFGRVERQHYDEDDDEEDKHYGDSANDNCDRAYRYQLLLDEVDITKQKPQHVVYEETVPNIQIV